MPYMPLPPPSWPSLMLLSLLRSALIQPYGVRGSNEILIVAHKLGMRCIKQGEDSRWPALPKYVIQLDLE